MRKLGFGIIGLGAISKTLILALQKSNFCNLVAAYDIAEGKAKSMCQKLNIKGYDNIEEFLKDENLEVVIIGTPSGLHLEPALKVIKAKKHLVIEKPLEITPERCNQILNEAKKNGVKVAGIMQSRYYEAPMLIKQAIDEGRFGQIVMIEASIKWFRSQEYYDSGAWRGTWEIDGGGVLMNQGIHAIDLLAWFGGAVDEVSAFTKTLTHKRIEVEDNGVAILKFKSGALGLIAGSTSIYPGFFKKLEIYGTKGSAILEEESLTTWQFENEIDQDEVIRQKYNSNTAHGGFSDPGAINYIGHSKVFDDVALSIINNNEPNISGEEAAKAVKIINSIYESSKKGEPIKVF